MPSAVRPPSGSKQVSPSGGSQLKHLDQARRNYRVYSLLRDDDFVDWAATALFYTAMHVVEAWLEEALGTTSGSHDSRAMRMNRLGVPRRVFQAYDALRRASELARYRDWTALLDADRIASLCNGPYRLICEHFEAPDAITPD